MALYFFHERNGNQYTIDEHGIDLPDIETVRREAVAGARAIIADAVLLGRVSLRQRFEIVDVHGNLVLTLPFHSVIEIDG